MYIIIGEIDFYTTQVIYNRGWRLMYLGLRQAEPFKRYMAMYAINMALPVMLDTLLDAHTREVYT